MVALHVHQVVGDAHGGFHQNLARAAAHPFFLDLAQDRQRQVVIRADQTGSVAMGAGLGRRLDHAGTQTLARHFHQAEATDAAHLNAGPVGFQLVLDLLFHGGVIAALVHIDKVDHDQTCQIAQAQLTGHFLGGFKVGLEGGFLDRAFLGGPPRVDVDGDKRLCHADHDITARFQLHGRVEHRGQIAFDLMAREKRHLVAVVFHVHSVGRHDHFHEVLGNAVTALALDQHLVNLAAVKVADRAFDQIALFIDFRRRNGFQRQLADLLPQAQQIFIIALYLGLCALGPSSSHDQTCTLRHVDLVGDFLELLAVHGIRNLATDTAATGCVGHQHAITTGQRQIGGQCSTLVAAFFLDDLHQQDLPDLDDFLDLVAPCTGLADRADIFGVVIIRDGFDAVIALHRLDQTVIILFIARQFVFRFFDRSLANHFHRRCALGDIGLVEVDGLHTGDFIAFRIAGGNNVVGFDGFRAVASTGPRARTAGAWFFLVILAALRVGIGLFFLHQRLTVGDGDLVVIRVDFREGQKTVTVSAVIHKSCLQRGFNPRDFCQIDIAS